MDQTGNPPFNWQWSNANSTVLSPTSPLYEHFILLKCIYICKKWN